MSTYLTQLRDKPGWYFQRAVPQELQPLLGRKLWRWKAGNTKPEARQAAVRLLDRTDRLISEAKGSKRSVKEIGHTESREEARAQAEAWLRGKTDSQVRDEHDGDIWLWGDVHSHYLPNDPAELQAIQDLPPVKLIDAAELIEKAVRIKSPAESTRQQWTQRLREFMQQSGLTHPSLGTKAQARGFRDYMLSRNLKPSTIKTRINYLSGLWSLMIDEEIVELNIWSGITRAIKSDPEAQEPLTIGPIDLAAEAKLDGDHLRLYLLLRYSGMRLGEAAGLRYEDLNLVEAGIPVIEVVGHHQRTLKTPQSKRKVPMHPRLQGLEWRGKGLIFPEFYNEKTHRWGAGLTWTRKIGISPKQLRHHAKQAMREAGIDSAVSRAVLGHKPLNVGEGYGGITITQKLRAVATLG